LYVRLPFVYFWGNLERPIAATKWEVPDRVEVERRHLYWRTEFFLGEDKEFRTETAPARGMLDEFLSLEGKSDEKYAQRWGLLQVQRIANRPGLRKGWIGRGNLEYPIYRAHLLRRVCAQRGARTKCHPRLSAATKPTKTRGRKQWLRRADQVKALSTRKAMVSERSEICCGSPFRLTPRKARRLNRES
jgi:hypothetical protein